MSLRKNVYKFENYPNRDFPVYSSVQQNKESLVMSHFHDDIEFIYVCAGEVTFSLGTEKHSCKNNEIIYIPPHTVHQAMSNTANASIRGFTFHPSILKPYLPKSESYSFSICQNATIYAKECPYYGELLQVFQSSIEIYDNKPSTFQLDMTAHILMLVSILIRSNAIFYNDKEDNYSRIKPAIEYIEENFRHKINISDLSRLVNVCDDHFIRIFKAATSRTPTAYITDIRLHQALRLLSLDRYSISEISDMTGFSNIQYFSHIFKERFGVSPSAYNKAQRNR